MYPTYIELINEARLPEYMHGVRLRASVILGLEWTVLFRKFGIAKPIEDITYPFDSRSVFEL